MRRLAFISTQKRDQIFHAGVAFSSGGDGVGFVHQQLNEEHAYILAFLFQQLGGGEASALKAGM